MRAIVNYFRSLFCQHDCELIADITDKVEDEWGYKISYRKVYRCKKCGYVQRVKL